MKECKELKISSNSLVEQNRIITLLWKLCLNEDKYFYFLYEPTYIVIRTREEEMNKLLDVLNKINDNEIKAFEVGDYKEWSKDVLDNQDAFSNIMHEASMIELSGKSNLILYERLSHCIFHIMRVSLFEEAKSSGRKGFSEYGCLSDLALGRAYTEGLLYGRYISEEDLKKCGLS